MSLRPTGPAPHLAVALLLFVFTGAIALSRPGLSRPGPETLDPREYFQPDVEYIATLENCERHIMATEYREGWKGIEWRKSLDAALQDARGLNRPVLVFFYIEEYHRDAPT